jgi:DNA-binding NarL/FixJ family response regulator
MKTDLKILLADDHALIAGTIRQVIDSYSGMTVVGSVRNGREALGLLQSQPIDVLVCDWRMPVLDGPGVLQEIRAKGLTVPVLMLSMDHDAPTIRRAFAAGALGFISKTDDLDEFSVAIRSVAAGQRFLSQSARLSLSAQPGIDELLSPPEIETISAREREVLRLIAQQYSSRQIAQALFISEETVKTHRKHLFRKLGVQTSIGLVQYALKHGLLE